MRGSAVRGSLTRRNMHNTSRACFSALQPGSQLQPTKEPTDPTSDRIHILGLGNLGRLFAHGLATKPDPPPITLLLHRESLFKEWKDAGENITLSINGIPSKSSNFEVEIIDSQNPKSREPISNLIVATKAPKTLQALSQLKDRLSPSSTILLTQNGMGTVQEVSTSLFPDPAWRPTYINAIVSHGLFSTGPFASVHAGEGDIMIAHVARKDFPQAKNNEFGSLVRHLSASPLLNAFTASPIDGMMYQMKKLVANATINPLTVLFDCKNGNLFTGDTIERKLARLLLDEISPVLLERIHSLVPPSLSEGSEKTKWHAQFSPAELERHMDSIARHTANNVSSMLQDVRASRETEIDYINGWLVKEGLEQGRNMRANQILVEMVKSKEKLESVDIRRRFDEGLTNLKKSVMPNPFEEFHTEIVETK